MNWKSSERSPATVAEGEESVPVARHYLYPGTLFAHRQAHLVTTVLGSCVSVCLWDAAARVGGINHYLLPLWNGEGLATPKYGNIAIVKLIEKVQSYGAGGKVVPKVFGFLWSAAISVVRLAARSSLIPRTARCCSSASAVSAAKGSVLAEPDSDLHPWPASGRRRPCASVAAFPGLIAAHLFLRRLFRVFRQQAEQPRPEETKQHDQFE